MELFKISKDEYQDMETLSRFIQSKTRGCRQKEKSYGDHMIRNAIIKRVPIYEIPEVFRVLVIKNANASFRYNGRYGDYYRTVEIFEAKREFMKETRCFVSFDKKRVKKENVLAIVF